MLQQQQTFEVLLTLFLKTGRIKSAALKMKVSDLLFTDTFSQNQRLIDFSEPVWRELWVMSCYLNSLPFHTGSIRCSWKGINAELQMELTQPSAFCNETPFIRNETLFNHFKTQTSLFSEKRRFFRQFVAGMWLGKIHYTECRRKVHTFPWLYFFQFSLSCFRLLLTK